MNDLQKQGSPELTTDRFGNSNCAYQFYKPKEFQGSDWTYLGMGSTSFNFITTYEPGWSISLWYQGGTQIDVSHIPNGIYYLSTGKDLSQSYKVSILH